MKFARATMTLLAVFALVGCGKQAEEQADAQPDATAEATTDATAASPAQAAAPEQDILPGASSVRSAFENKDYDSAVGALLALKVAAAAPEQNQAYLLLYDEVKFGLMDASATDPKAASALMKLRATSAGR